MMHKKVRNNGISNKSTTVQRWNYGPTVSVKLYYYVRNKGYRVIQVGIKVRTKWLRPKLPQTETTSG